MPSFGLAANTANRRRRSYAMLIGLNPAKPGIYGTDLPPPSQKPFMSAPNVTPVTYVEPEDGSFSPDSTIPPASEIPSVGPARRRAPPRKCRSTSYIPRPPNAFMLFRADFVRQTHVPGSIETDHGSLSEIIGEALLGIKAKHAKAEHKVKYPNYRLRPVHNKNKEKKKDKALPTPEDERLCEEVAQLLLEGKKGAELAEAVRNLDRIRSQTPVVQPVPLYTHRRSSSLSLPHNYYDPYANIAIPSVFMPSRPRPSSSGPAFFRSWTTPNAQLPQRVGLSDVLTSPKSLSFYSDSEDSEAGDNDGDDAIAPFGVEHHVHKMKPRAEFRAPIGLPDPPTVIPLTEKLASLQKHALIALYKLSKETLLYPHCHVLKDIVFDQHESRGAFSDIHRGHHRDQQLCLKVVRLHQKSDTDAMLKTYAKEAILWGQLHHPNIVPFYGIYYLNNARRQVCLVSPWMRHGNLVEYLKSNPSSPRIPFVYDVTAGLNYMHSRGLVHSDSKGLNVLSNDSGRACITDFGLSFIRIDQTLAYTIPATTVHGFSYHWAAPELLDDGSRSTMASDIWVLGCVYYEILTGNLPYHGLSDAQIIRRLLQGIIPERPPHLAVISQAESIVWKLVERVWVMEAEQRPRCREILKELEAGGLVRTLEVEFPAGMERDGRRSFEEAMKHGKEMPTDLIAVGNILGGTQQVK
ncbi:hypothetical protein D9756_006803 [Leucocoprinus leucothites]|uniref:Protein kinase domain-containing protein n=1 Tax=Leucocoprinus leucothites TaxID=201217 RepID=A0A8H5LH19_9AGAR|nr:hypothetical protein D9756_006803 [Leucoagaricus leucothites]